MKEHSDTHRLDFVLRVLSIRGTEGLAQCLAWECCTEPTRAHIDHAIHLEQQAIDARTRLDQLVAQRAEIERQIAALPKL